jgi:hypothetical protein
MHDLNLTKIYKDVQNPEVSISIEYIPCECGTVTRTCVFGVLASERGLKIKKEMLSWLTKEYNVYCVNQAVPGRLYEYPAIRFAQWLCQNGEQWVLYVHTKGAAKPRLTQMKVRKMWKYQFTGSAAEDYISSLDNFDVVCPLLGPNNETWYNGMFISGRAFEKIGDIVPSEDRYDYQRLFRSSNIKARGILKEKMEITHIDAYMLSHEFSRNGVTFTHDFCLTIEY